MSDRTTKVIDALDVLIDRVGSEEFFRRYVDLCAGEEAMNKELPKVYVFKPSEEEAIEIVERIVENGGKLFDTTGEHGNYLYDVFNCWGYHDNYGTYTGEISSFEHIGAKRVTMDEFRKLFPSKSDVVLAEKSEKQLDAMLEALKYLTAAYRRLGGLECAWDKELLVAEAVIKKMEVGDETKHSV